MPQFLAEASGHSALSFGVSCDDLSGLTSCAAKDGCMRLDAVSAGNASRPWVRTTTNTARTTTTALGIQNPASSAFRMPPGTANVRPNAEVVASKLACHKPTSSTLLPVTL